MKSFDPDVAPAHQRRFLLLVVAAISALFLWMVGGFLMALLLAAITAGMTHPIHRRLERRLGGRSVLSSILVLLGLLVLVIGPLFTLLGLVIGQTVELSQQIGPWIEARTADPDALSLWIEGLPIWQWLPIEPVLPERERVLEIGANAVRNTGALLVDGLAAAGRGTAAFVLGGFIYLYAVFFFLISGREILDRVLYLSPLEAEDEALVIERFVSVTRATLRGSLLIGGIQGLLTGIGFAVAGISGAAYWGTIVVVLSVIPGIGAPLVWLPAVLWLFATGEATTAIALAAWCALAVGSIDNVLRPRLVGSDARMSDLMILISTLGGISLFGAPGFVIGPIVAAVFVTLWDVYGRVFADALPPIAPTLADEPGEASEPEAPED
ncbi:MAG: AI-2E family transporter [bacterium]|nr:AI-2E family transporter [bacterium]